MDYTLIWSFRNRYEELERSILTANEMFPEEVKFCLVDAASSEDTIRKVRALANSLTRSVRICESSFRTSLSQAWNLGMMLSDTKHVIFASSDVVFLSEELFINLKARPEKYVLVGNHSVFMIDKEILDTVGWFDEEYILGPHFDCDYMIKASEAGFGIGNIPNAGYYIHEDPPAKTIERTTSEVPDRLPMNDFTNDRIFKDKWDTSWPGWKAYANQVDKPHPPTHITQVRRKKPETNWHPSFTHNYE